MLVESSDPSKKTLIVFGWSDEEHVYVYNFENGEPKDGRQQAIKFRYKRFFEQFVTGTHTLALKENGQLYSFEFGFDSKIASDEVKVEKMQSRSDKILAPKCYFCMNKLEDPDEKSEGTKYCQECS